MSDSTRITGDAAEVRCAECACLLQEGQDREATDGGVFCRRCFEMLAERIRQAVAAQGSDVPYGKAAVGGLLGGALGGLAWWGVTVLTHVSIGLVAIVIGILVGKGVVRLAGGKRSPGLQGLSVSIAALSFACASYFVNRTFLQEAFAEQGRPTILPLLPAPGLFFEVVKLGFGVMDIVFLAIVVYEAWKIPRPIELRA